MYAYIAVLAIAITVITCTPSRTHHLARIVGGKNCSIKNHPFVVTVLSHTLCGGTVLSMSWILTAAHCLAYKSTGEKNHEDHIWVRAGFTLARQHIQIRKAKKFIQHKKFDYEKFDDSQDLRFDIALVVVETPFESTKFFHIAKLPTPGFSNSCKTVTAFGIGETELLTLQSLQQGLSPEEAVKRPLKCVKLHVAHKDNCSRYFPIAEIDETVIFTSDEKAVDACQGDSGGPIVCSSNNVVIGIISYGTPCGLISGCGAYTKVESYLGYIRSTIRSNNEPKLAMLSTEYFWKFYVYIYLLIIFLK